MFDLEYFRRFVVDRPWTCKPHNMALKWARDSMEAVGEDSLELSNTDGYEVPEIIHPNGTQYSFNERGQ